MERQYPSFARRSAAAAARPTSSRWRASWHRPAPAGHGRLAGERRGMAVASLDATDQRRGTVGAGERRPRPPLPWPRPPAATRRDSESAAGSRHADGSDRPRRATNRVSTQITRCFISRRDGVAGIVGVHQKVEQNRMNSAVQRDAAGDRPLRRIRARPTAFRLPADRVTTGTGALVDAGGSNATGRLPRNLASCLASAPSVCPALRLAICAGGFTGRERGVSSPLWKSGASRPSMWRENSPRDRDGVALVA